MHLSRKILSDPVTRWVFSYSPDNTYITGGYVRDILRGEQARDRDFVLKGNIEKTGRKAAEIFGGKVIALHKKQTCRVVLGRRGFIDFSYMNKDIASDLRRRDFTINAIAWAPGPGIIDPDNFADDIKKRLIRQIRPQNFLVDPLRILRAYRLSAQLNFEIEYSTRKALKQYSRRVISAAPERITEELFKILTSNNSHSYLQLCTEDNILSRLLRLTYGNIIINLNALKSFDRIIHRRDISKKEIFSNNYLSAEISQGLDRRGLVRFYLLLRKYDKSGHRIYSRKPLIETLEKREILRISRKIRSSLRDMKRAEEPMASCHLTDKRIYFMYKNAGECVYECAVLLSLMKPGSCERIISLAHDFLHKRDISLLNGHDIQRILGIGSGRAIGQIKERILEASFLGTIRNRREAREFIRLHFT